MANKNLAEIKILLKTDKVFETETSFLVNDFGKYRPNITFVVRKDFEGDTLTYRSDAPTREMLAGMNVNFDGSNSVIFGDFWVSKKGGACFRPKPVATAQHVLVRCDWGGAFSKTRGCGRVEGVVYYRHAVSNGGGTGYDYVVVPVGFYRAMRDEEIDGDVVTTAPDFTERAKAVRGRFAIYDREQTEKASAEAQAEAQAEDASKAARAGLLPRLEKANGKLVSLGYKAAELGEAHFTYSVKWASKSVLFSDGNVAIFEREVEEKLEEKTEQERKRIARGAFQPKFEAFKARAEAIGLKIEFGDETVRLSGECYGQPYSDDGLAKFVTDLDCCEREAAEAKEKANAEAAYQQRKTEASALGLPSDVRIWFRSGRTNAGCGWVVGSNGMDRKSDSVDTSMHSSNTKRYHQSYEGDHVWDQILIGEVVLKWSKGSSAATHEFEVIHLPTEGLTEAQLERIHEIQDELETEWEGARGLASGLPSPPVGEGWDLLPKEQSKPVSVPVATKGQRANAGQLEALREHFGK